MKKKFFLLFILFGFAIESINAQYQILLNFDSANGAKPEYSNLTLSGSMLYGMTPYGGSNNMGCIFCLDTNGNKYRDLLDFNGTNGKWPYGSLILLNSKLYGMTWEGGANNDGSIYSIDTNGSKFKNMFDFDYTTNGALPMGSLTLSGSRLYGMNAVGGTHKGGCIFSIDTSGAGFSVLHVFIDSNTNVAGSLIVGNGLLYGMTQEGGAWEDGYIFSIDTNGNGFNDLFDFHADGWPEGSLTLSGSTLFGLTQYGGLHGKGALFSINTNGSNYKDLVGFNGTGSIAGYYPLGSLILSHGSLYGMTLWGGSDNDGVVFKVDTNSIASINEIQATYGDDIIFPNPNNGIFTIQSSVVSGQSSVEIYNVLGEKVYSKLNIQHSQFKINLSNQPNGIYLYRMVKADGSLIGEGKIVIEK